MTPGTLFLTFAAVLFVGDLIAVRRRCRFIEAYEHELRGGR